MGVQIQIIVEGQTEQIFVEQILIPYLNSKGIFCFCHVIPTKITCTTRRGGVSSFVKIEKDIKRSLKYRTQYVTTMFDLYRIPNDTPGKEDIIPGYSGMKKVQVIENAVEHLINNYRFIPYIQLHEFEALFDSISNFL